MKLSIQTKLIGMSLSLVFLTTISISTAYYMLARKSQQRESQNRIQVAFDMIMEDVHERQNTYKKQVDELLKRESVVAWTASVYNQQQAKLDSRQFIVSYLVTLAPTIKNFGYISSIDRVLLFGLDGRLLLAYQRRQNEEKIGGYVISATGQDTYLSLENPSEVAAIMYTGKPIPDAPLPQDFPARYDGAVPDETTVSLAHDTQRLFFLVSAPVFHNKQKVGILICETAYTQENAEHFASLSKTDVNFFVGDRFSLGTLTAQTRLDPHIAARAGDCDAIQQSALSVASVEFNEDAYFQGQCALRSAQGVVGAITVSLSQEFEQEQVREMIAVVLMVSSVSFGAAIVLAFLFSRRTIHAIQHIVRVIHVASDGDLRETAIIMTQDELGMLAQKLNQMIMQLRALSKQVQTSAISVGATSDAILAEIEALTRSIEQQSISVDNTTDSVTRINSFIAIIGENTSDLSAAAQQILFAIHQTRASRQEVTTSIGHLAQNLQTMLASAEQMNASAKDISEHVGDLEGVARQTSTAMQRIDQSLKDVSNNAAQSQQLANDTREAARRGQESVNVSIQGMVDLKTAVSNTAQIIQEVNSWGEQVSSILDIVDEVTEQTSLLALNASIISAQAGAHGRGFAVVADEIKELAMRTRNSTQRISALIHTLRKKTEAGVKHMKDGLMKAEQGMELSYAVKEALDTILERATNSSERAAGTAQVIQDIAASSRIISTSMSSVTSMVSQINDSILRQQEDMALVVESVENSQALSLQVNQASIEQNHNIIEIEKNMQHVTEKLENISHQTEDLRLNSGQIVGAMQTIEVVAENVLNDVMTISSQTANNLVKQAEALESMVKVFKV